MKRGFGMAGLRLLSTEPVPDALRDQILMEIPDLSWRSAVDVPIAAEMLTRVDVAFGHIPASAIPESGPLRWIQFPFAGVPNDLCRCLAERGILLTNASGNYDRTIAEHVLGVMIAMARRLDLCLDLQHRRVWAHPVLPPIEDLAGQTVAIVGMGSLGQAIARHLKHLGMRVVGCRRRFQATPYVDQLFEVNDLPAMVKMARWLVVCAPLTSETTGIISRDVLSAMPPGSRLVNVGRGALLDHDALGDLLRSGHLAGAALDVFPSEPLPTESPIWSFPNTILTAHASSNPVDSSTHAAEVLLRNLHRFTAGEPLENQVDLNAGY